MPTTTLEMPYDVVTAAQGYASREHKTVAELFVDLFCKTYGFDRVCVVRPKVNSDVDKECLLDSITGVASLPADKACDDLKWEHLREKYGL